MLSSVLACRLAIIFAAVFCLSICISGSAQAATAHYRDGVFNDSDWALTLERTSGAAGGVAANQVLTGGLPCAYRYLYLAVCHQPNVTETSWGFNMRNDATYDPGTQGALSSIRFDADIYEYAGYHYAYGPALSQNGKFYYVAPFSTNGWSHVHSESVVATDFRTTVDAGDHPDFSATGLPIRFGFVIAYTVDCISSGYCCAATDGGIDNWAVTVDPAVPYVPPSSSGTPIITATAGANGTITPDGAVSVTCGAGQTFVIVPDPSYQIADVQVDGASVGAVASYTFMNVMDDHTIAATFTPAQTAYCDGVFNNADWTLVYQCNGNTPCAYPDICMCSRVDAYQVLTEGTPSEYRFALTEPGDYFGNGHWTHAFGFNLRNGAVYDPSTQGPISSLSYDEDALLLPSPCNGGTCDYSTCGQEAGPALRQNGKLYYYATFYTYPGYCAWKHLRLSLGSASNELFRTVDDPNDHPNFSTGGPIQFGYVRANYADQGAYTVYGGIDNWCVSVNDVLEVPGEPTISASARIHAAPNPFLGLTTVEFALAEMQDVHVGVFDVAGRQVRLLHSGSLGAGVHHMKWDGLDLQGQRCAGGVYFIRMTRGDVRLQTKVMLLR
jgi:hypothetical protein